MLEITPKLDNQSEKPLYVQLYEYIKQEIKMGNLTPDVKLPSKRRLAAHLSLSQNTIEAAYEQLIAEGYLLSIPRKGYYVSELDQHLVENNNSQRSASFIKEKQYQDSDCLYDFTQTGVDARSFPFSLFRKLTNEISRPENDRLLKLGHPQGDYDFRKAIAKYLYESRGVCCSPSQIIIGAGTQYLMRLLFQLLQKGVFAVEDPGYHRRHVAFEKWERVKMIPLDQDGMIVSRLEESGANIAFVTPSHQFPCGMIMPISRRMQLLHWANLGEGRYIIEDDYDSEFRYSGKPIPALQGLDTNGKVVYMGTFSKALLPSLRVSYMVLPKPLIEIYQNEYFFYAQTVSRMDQDLLRRFLEEGYWEKQINKMRVIYHKKRDILVSEIMKQFPDPAEIIGQDSGLHVLVRVKNGMTEQELIGMAGNFKCKVYPLSAYGSHDNMTVLLGYAALSEEEIEESVKCLARAWF
ncbi:MocR-like pyridoxine biosynthesis transcription factor PdxR [Cytobacillus massiliigabonensis]|uniref:MocR-like pyridoxine biosynthesis transcription factor PdxR n=1 Tax=Cytobacillus massiliigabonensis TaxID=1871011 RepID=UPI000C85FB72|nr:PLP-dependent aminotransferase family protein [Cytobacillus massiliigabonensis]